MIVISVLTNIISMIACVVHDMVLLDQASSRNRILKIGFIGVHGFRTKSAIRGIELLAFELGGILC